jgi:hypothetical protein
MPTEHGSSYNLAINYHPPRNIHYNFRDAPAEAYTRLYSSEEDRSRPAVSGGQTNPYRHRAGVSVGRRVVSIGILRKDIHLF